MKTTWMALAVLLATTAGFAQEHLTLRPEGDVLKAARKDWAPGAIAMDWYGLPTPAAEPVAATQPATTMAAEAAGSGVSVAPMTLATAGAVESKDGGVFGALGKAIDFGEVRANDASLEVVRVLAPTGRVQPYAAAALESKDRPDEKGRVGVGAGTQWNISKRASFGTELLVFPSDRDLGVSEGAGKLGDVRVLTRLQITF